MHHNVYLHWMIEWMLFPFNIRHFDCVPMHQTTSTTINRSKNSGQWREDSYARHAYNNNYATQWKDVGSHSCNRQMMYYILTFRPVLPSPIAMVQDVLVFCATCGVFFDDVRPPAVRVGCRYVIVRKTTMAYWATAGFYVCRISTVVWATGRVTCTYVDT